MDHVADIRGTDVWIVCAAEPLRKRLRLLGARAAGSDWIISCGSRTELAQLLGNLQRLGLPFGNAPSGWPPAAVFQQMRDEGLVHGAIQAVAWRGPAEPFITEV